MSRKIATIILALVSVAVLVNYLVIKPTSIDFVDGQLKEKFNGYITYKNSQKGFLSTQGLSIEDPAARMLSTTMSFRMAFWLIGYRRFMAFRKCKFIAALKPQGPLPRDGNGLI